MARIRKSYRKSNRRTNSNVGALLVFVVAICFLAVMSFQIQGLSATYRRYAIRYESQQKELREEQQRNEELKEKKASPQTDEDIEKVAREQLGLIKPGEILLKPKK